MKKWQKILLIILLVIVTLIVSGIIIYKVKLEPVVEEKIDVAIEKVEKTIKDESFQEQVDSMAQSMIDDGVIAVESIPTYNQIKTENEQRREAAQKAKATPTPSPTPMTKKSLKEKLKAAMTADEFAFALSLYSRIDLGYAQSLLKTDRAAAKAYIYSKASSAEISRALEIYAKYSYLLK